MHLMRVGERMDSMFEEGGKVLPVDLVNIQHSQAERPVIPSSSEKDDGTKPSTSESSREETMPPSSGKSPRILPKPGDVHSKIVLLKVVQHEL